MKTTAVINEIAKDFNISKEKLLNDSIRYYLEKELKDLKIKLFQIGTKYNITTIDEFENLYRSGKISENNTFEDYKNFDRLEFKKEKIETILKRLN
ncbi:MAG TPA: hypothetical protein PLG34_09055 [Spirochaetota bacterium]|jgi:hypothetical protein|nr:MAG: hypothetical protein BWX91_02245 [Spirochaetes bacterium ADurb.Bin133]HNZ27312.1 hypothetical protein [Spirochaetota bacterium]HPY88116.1 hypothetical protein [Spirochaetota bacterium]HQB61521.1 hypothetical protein [Spirochaetota bacterium]HRU44109.1 hypothetical protein [Spirochaetota bacterium]